MVLMKIDIGHEYLGIVFVAVSMLQVQIRIILYI